MRSSTDAPRAYLAKLPPAISGSDGSGATLRAACELARFGLSDNDAMALLGEWNATHCRPPWSERELAHKWQSARRKVGPATRLAARPAAVRVAWAVERKSRPPAPLAPTATPKPVAIVTAPAAIPTTAKPFPILDLPDDFFSTYPAARPALDNQRLTPPPAAQDIGCPIGTADATTGQPEAKAGIVARGWVWPVLGAS